MPGQDVLKSSRYIFSILYKVYRSTGDYFLSFFFSSLNDRQLVNE